MLTDRDCKMIVQYLCDALKSDTDLQDIMAKAIMKSARPKVRLVKIREAAAMLGISQTHLHHIKDDENGHKRFSYIKTGPGKTAHLLFDANRLLPEYERYVALGHGVRCVT